MSTVTTLTSVTDSKGHAWPVTDAQGSAVELDPRQANDLAEAARRIASELPADASLDNQQLLIKAEVALRAAPDLVAALVEFRVSGSRDGVLLLRGLPIDDPLPPTPERGAFQGSWRELTVSSLAQIMVMSVLGDVIAYADEKEGRLIQDICPVPGAEQRQENTGSSLLELHTEDGFHRNKPHQLSLLALRGDRAGEAITVAASVRACLSLLDSNCIQTLREPLFRVRLSSSFVGDATAYSDPMPVLSSAAHDPDLCVDFHATEPTNEAAAMAFEELRQQLLGCLVGVVLKPGDMMIVDNRRAVHGRTAFTPHYDGEDRWLRRCFAVTDIRRAYSRLFPDSRVHQPLVARPLSEDA
jgi:L-asparagine oxygenase